MTAPYWHWDNPNIVEWGTQTNQNFTNSDNGGPQTTQNGSLAPFSQNWKAGYQPKVSALQTDQTMQALYNQSNANFCDPKYKMTLWVNDVSIGFGMTGTQAQGRTTRDFYPQAFSLPYFTISGQCPDEANYGRLAEYVHAANRFEIGAGNMGKITGLTSRNPLIQLWISKTPYVHLVGGQNNKIGVTRVTARGTKIFHGNQMIVGPRQETLCKGYIGSFTRVHQQGVFQPAWSAEFQVVEMIIGLWEDKNVTENETGTWLSVLKGTNSQKFSTAKNQAQNKKILSEVSKDSANVSNVL